MMEMRAGISARRRMQGPPEMPNANDLPPPAEQTDVLWFLPTHGDGRYLGSDVAARHVTLNYLGQIARAADELDRKSVV